LDLNRCPLYAKERDELEKSLLMLVKIEIKNHYMDAVLYEAQATE
jgi:hypothetical protein